MLNKVNGIFRLKDVLLNKDRLSRVKNIRTAALGYILFGVVTQSLIEPINLNREGDLIKIGTNVLFASAFIFIGSLMLSRAFLSLDRMLEKSRRDWRVKIDLFELLIPTALVSHGLYKILTQTLLEIIQTKQSLNLAVAEYIIDAALIVGIGLCVKKYWNNN